MGSFIYISVCALLCNLFLFITFSVARKNQIINSFLLALLALITWTGCSVFMRMQLWPSVKFWYDLSLLGMWMFPCSILLVVRRYMGKGYALSDWIVLVMVLAANVYNMITQRLLAAPAPVVQQNGNIAFEYTFTARTTVLYAMGVLAFLKVAVAIIRYGRAYRAVRRQFRPILVGIALMLLGHILIAIPVFAMMPLDIVAGVINAACIFYTLYRRRLFKLTLLASRRSCYILSIGFTFMLFAYLLDPIQQLLNGRLGSLAEYSVLIIALCYAVSTMIFSTLMKRLIDQLFAKEEQSQTKLMEDFSLAVSKSLRVDEILERLVDIIKQSIAPRRVSVCMQDGNGCYRIVCASDPLERPAVVFSQNNPIIEYLRSNDACLMMQDIHCVPGYRSLWENEKKLFQRLGVKCFVPLREGDELVGVVLLSEKSKNKRYTYSDESFLMSVKSVASIALKNAKLYEKAYHDARTDDLTGLINRKYFHETLNTEFDRWKDSRITLMLLNVDDFKLFNQLYGNQNGDLALKAIARIIVENAGENGISARYSGKEFAIILPGVDVVAAQRIAKNIREQLTRMNRLNGDHSFRTLTVSVGICAAPYGAVTAKQLISHAEQAVYEVKRSGKNGVMVFAAAQETSPSEQSPRKNLQDVYSEYAPTIYALTAAIDAKDHYTFKHSENVAYYATRLASAMGLDEDSVEIINEAALLHDVGKIGVSEAILNKPGPLTNEEYEEMKRHVDHSVGIIRHLPSLDFVIPAVIGHHERFDGRGYPRRVAGEDIPLSARILCVVDSFDAMTSDRVYKKGYSVEHALSVLEEQSGRQFDPRVARVFIDEFKRGNIVLQFSSRPDELSSPLPLAN